jgi:hypothetical protein
MGETLFQLFNAHQTQPVQKLEAPKLAAVFDYLIFSGLPVFVNRRSGSEILARLNENFVLADVTSNELIFEADHKLTNYTDLQDLEVSFGYKRAKASFHCKAIRAEENRLLVSIPQELQLINRRSNPRLQIDRELFKNGLKAKLVGSSSIGRFEINEAQVYEISQYGMSLFVRKSDAVLLPRDVLEEISIEFNGKSVVRTQGVVNRVDIRRNSPELEASYEIVVHFTAKRRSEGQQARRARRTPILDTKPCFFSAEHPLFPGRKIKGQVFEISSSGLSCILEETQFPVLSGMKLYDCQLQLPYCPPRPVAFEVMHVEMRSDGETSKFRLGGEFINGSVELIKDIAAYTQANENPLIQDLSEADLDLLWSFMFETNFIYPSKRKKIQHQSQEILKTYKRLLSTDNPIVKKLVFKEDDAIKGHLSTVRFYDNAWIVQHLNATKAENGKAGYEVVMAMSDFLSDAKAHNRSEIFYSLSFYRPDNIYPRIMFGESARIMNDSAKVVTYDFEFGVMKDAPAPNSIPSGIEVDSEIAVEGLRSLFIEQNYHNFLRAIGFGNSDPLKITISEEYSRLGLYRERHVVSIQEGGNSAYGLVEISSPGLNLSELTNSVFLFTQGSNSKIKKELAERLVEFVSTVYFDPRGMTAIILLPKGEEFLNNVSWEKTYTLWCLNSNAVSEFKTVATELMSDLKAHIVRIKNSKDSIKSNSEKMEDAPASKRSTA